MKRWIWIGVGMLVVLGLLAVPGYKFFKQWRAEGLSRQAERLVEEDPEALVRAWEKASAAYFLAPKNLEVVRTLAGIYNRADPAKALPHWRDAVELSEGALEDRLGLAKAALEVNNLELVASQLEAIEVTAETSEEVARVKAGYLARNFAYGEALDVLEPWIDREDSTEDLHSLFLQISLASQDAALRQRGLDHIIALTERDDMIGLKAIRLLLPLRKKTPALETLLEQRLGEHPQIKRADRLLWLSWKLRNRPVDAEAIYREAVALYDLEDAEALIELARWLNQNGFSARVLDLVSIEKAKLRKDLFLVTMDALALQNRWERIRQVLESEDVPLENYLRQVFLARSYYETGLERRADLGWQKVRLEVANDPEKLRFFANYAHKLGLYEEARDAYQRLQEIPISQRQGFAAQVQMERALGETEHLHEVLEAMHEAYPDDIAVENDLYYTGILLEETDAGTISKVRKLIEKNPNYLSHRMTLALALLKNGQAGEALDVFDALNIPIEQLSATFRTVLGSVLRANDQDAEADAVFRGVDPRQLLPEEQVLFEEYASA